MDNRYLYEMRPNIHPDSLPPLHRAALDGDIHTIETLLESGADPNIESDQRYTAVDFATMQGNAAALHVLLKAGANPDRPTRIPPLCRAAGRGDSNCVRLLLRYGASANPIRNDGDEPPVEPAYGSRIPLFAAAQGGNAECVRLLLDAGARIHTVDVCGETASMNASSSAAVRILLQAGASLHSQTELVGSVINHAVDNGFHEAIQALVEAGADIDDQTTSDRTPLIRHCASCERNAAMIQALIDAGANLHARWFRGRTALHEAVQVISGDRFPHFESAIRTLVAAGLDVNIRDDEGSTPLHYALGEEGGAEEAVKTLLALGADPNIRNDKGQTPRDIADLYRCRHLAKLLPPPPNSRSWRTW